MATYVTVNSGDAGLVARARQLQQANREAQLQRQNDAALQTRAEGEITSAAQPLQGPQGGLPDTSVDRRPAAQRRGATLLPFAISWRGVLGGPYDTSVVTVLRTVEVLGSGTRYDLITSTYSGGRTLDPSPIRLASKAALASSPEVSRVEPYSTYVVTCVTSSSPDSCQLPSLTKPSQFPGQWLTAAKRYIENPYTPVLDAPNITLPVGSFEYTPSTSCVSVATDGTVYMMVQLPDQPVSLTERTYAEFIEAGYPQNTLITGYPVTMPYNDTSEPFRGLTNFIYATQPTQRYMFIKARGDTMESKIASPSTGQSFEDFIYANLYSDDPSRDARQAGYMGEYRLRNGTAKFLQLKTGDDAYTGFPYGYLQDYKDAEDLPVLPSGVGFEDFTYRLQPYSTTAELVEQLTALQTVGSATPISRVPVPTTQAVFASAKSQLGNDVGDEITPYLYFAVGQ